MKIFLTSIKFLLLMSILTGLIYPVFIYGIAKAFFPYKSEGSFIEINGNKIGSELIAQKFDSAIYFQSRPSAINYFPMPSGASNLAPTSKKLRDNSDSLKREFAKRNFLIDNAKIPPDAVFTSGSGIDPDISPENAFLQVERISLNRGFDAKKKAGLYELVRTLAQKEQYGIFGNPRINVTGLNIRLDKMK